MQPYLIKSISQMNSDKGVFNKHPLITVFNQKGSKALEARLYQTELYMIFLKDSVCAEIVYGRRKYDYQEGTLVFMEPGQQFGLEFKNIPMGEPNGWALAFHPDLLKQSRLQYAIKNFTFFSYAVHEALHLSNQERELISDQFSQLAREIERYDDQHSNTLILTHLELILTYAARYYERQFSTRLNNETDFSERFLAVLRSCLDDSLMVKQGPPNVAYCAQKMGFSANYLGDLTRQKLGISAKTFIDEFLVNTAREKLRYSPVLSIKQIAHSLGFEYQNHFSRFFKKHTQQTPSEFRSLIQ